MTKKQIKKTRMSNFYINAFYHSKFMDNLFVVKASGDIVEDGKALDSLMANIKKLTHHGIKIIFVYGGGKATDKALAEKKIKVIKKDGRRVTDKATLDVMKDTIGGGLSLKVYEAMARHNIEGLSLNAVPASWMTVRLRSKKPVDYGFVGDVISTRQRHILDPFKIVNFVAVPCMAWAEDAKTLCNINADTIATEIAIGAAADKLLFLSNVDGVLIKGKTALMLGSDEIPGLIKKGIVTDGMKVKMENCLKALNAGVKRIHLINGLRKDALEKEIFETVSPGTMILSADEKESYMNEIEIQKAIGA